MKNKETCPIETRSAHIDPSPEMNSLQPRIFDSIDGETKVWYEAGNAIAYTQSQVDRVPASVLTVSLGIATVKDRTANNYYFPEYSGKRQIGVVVLINKD
ncbi:hypothetical protein OGM63_23850 [Plectonema radiosum NIES-515]|uniref:Uncharacterized protein n=1 Tax=Plectonema radiosum NIES-515 TaxID=2986073 RepID=A0ABT3B6D4_9CYAN|nr:hypothetical protein [Plectonema radiosum]MCV3216510.1 hypothetical protein [Plectonema radiosum NIES-515]